MIKEPRIKKISRISRKLIRLSHELPDPLKASIFLRGYVRFQRALSNTRNNMDLSGGVESRNAAGSSETPVITSRSSARPAQNVQGSGASVQQAPTAEPIQMKEVPNESIDILETWETENYWRGE